MTSVEPSAPSSAEPQKNTRRSFPVRVLVAVIGPCTWPNIGAWLLLIAAVLLLRWTWIDQFRIPSGSMEPTLRGNAEKTGSFFTDDRVSINKFAYGLRFPLNGMRIPFTSRVIHYADRRLWRGAKPRRWDIAVFKSVEQENAGMTLVKRVVGLPGDRIHIADGKVYVNGKAEDPPEALRGVLHYTSGPGEEDVRRFVVDMARLPGPPAALDLNDPTGLTLALSLRALHDKLAKRDAKEVTDEEVKELTGGLAPAAFDVARRLLERKHEQMGTFRYGIRTEDRYALVPEGCYFLLGDNSGDSRDGRCFGWVPNEYILGRAFCIYWPVSRWRDFTGFSRTWWGRSVLYGVPALVAGGELAHRLRRYRTRRNARRAKHDATERKEG